MGNFDDLSLEIRNGIEGKNVGVSTGFDRLNEHFSLRKRIYSVIFGSSGSGKSALVHNMFILNPFEEYMLNRHNPQFKVKLKVILFSMERGKIYTYSKWLSRRIFLDHGILIPIPKLLGWWKDIKLTPDEHDLTLLYGDYFGELDEILTTYEGGRSPEDIYRIVKEHAESNGKEEQISQYKKAYIPNDDSQVTIVIADHFGITRLGTKHKNKKEAVDRLSEHFQYFRDFLGYSPVGVMQMTREKSNAIYQKMDSFEVNLDDAKESGRPVEDADAVISLFDPIRYNTNDPAYDAKKFRNNENGAKFFRSIKILKNTYGADDLRIGMAFHGAIGSFKELPKSKFVRENWSDIDYQRVTSGQYFLDLKH